MKELFSETFPAIHSNARDISLKFLSVMLLFHIFFRSKQTTSPITFPWNYNLISSRFLVEKLKHSKKIYLEQNKTFQSLPPLTSQLTLHCCLRNIGVNNFPQNEKKINFIAICVLEKLGLIVQVWIINSKYGGTYFWTIFFRKWEHKKWYLHIPSKFRFWWGERGRGILF